MSTHKDKVVIRKTINQLRGIDEREAAGYDDPITEYYGADAAEAVSHAARDARRRVVNNAKLKSRLVGRLLRWEDPSYALDVLERYAIQHRIIKGRFAYEIAEAAEREHQRWVAEGMRK